MAKKKTAEKGEKKKLTNEELEKLILDMIKQDIPPSKIGNKIKQEYGMTIKRSLGKMKKFLEKSKTKVFPEDLKNLSEKLKKLKKHLERNKNDKKLSRSLHITEGRIRRLSEYYKKKSIIPQDWEHKSS